MVVGEIPVQADFLVLGGGPGGYTAALRAAELGRRVMLVDRDGVDGLGGVCLRAGCIPSKALLDAAATVRSLSEMAVAGVRASGVSFDMGVWQQSKADIVDGLAGDLLRLMHAGQIDVIEGIGQLSRPDQLVVRSAIDPMAPSQFFQFRDLLLATGSRPTTLAGFTVDGESVLDSSSALMLAAVPASVAVIGGGYIGVELGTALAKLGSAVTIVEYADRLLPGLDAMFASPVLKGLRALGVDVRLGAAADAFHDGCLHGRHGDTPFALAVDKVIVAVGRTPNTDSLGLDAAGIAFGADGLIPVAADRRATRHIAAIGDITHGPALAHKASAEARVAAEALCGLPAAFDPATVPAVVFTDPEVATAGLTLRAARDAGIDAGAMRVPFGASGRAAALHKREGFLQLVWDRAGQTVIGTHIVGPHASELIAEAVLAIEMAATLDDVAGAIHAHPTLGELLGDAARAAVRS